MKRTIIAILLLVAFSARSQSVKPFDTVYHFTAKLTAAVPVPAPCGVTAFGTRLKFEVISTDMPGCANKYININVPCAADLGWLFFIAGDMYKINAARDSDGSFVRQPSYGCHYQEDRTPEFWSRSIIKVVIQDLKEQVTVSTH